MLLGNGESPSSVLTPISLSSTALAAACFASFFDLPVPIAEIIESPSIGLFSSMGTPLSFFTSNFDCSLKT